MADLFEAIAPRDGPLADRMRPTNIDQVVGQESLLGPEGIVRRLLSSGHVPSLVFWGPPGTGKTTLARLLARHVDAHFETLSAVLAGVSDLRKALTEARRRKGSFGRSTLLFVDEIHRWSKSQQDALLHAVETGLVTLVGATTENPSFELNRALLSRVQVFVLEALSAEAIQQLLKRALRDDPILAAQDLQVDGDALAALSAAADGDARRALSVLEMAVRDARQVAEAEGSEVPVLSRERIEASLRHRTLLYDKAGDAHYGVISAFIKSMRGTDPDAAVYYLVRMLESGEEPRFLLRRMVIFASEDVGNADPRALRVATDALRAFELVGLPEGVLPMVQAATYLALAPKSNAVLEAYGAARRAVRDHGALPVPPQLLPGDDAISRQLGHGRGYRYPHAQGGVVPGERYLPQALEELQLYRPRSVGLEKELAARAAHARRVRNEPAPSGPSPTVAEPGGPRAPEESTESD
jgi:putative ATPase